MHCRAGLICNVSIFCVGGWVRVYTLSFVLRSVGQARDQVQGLRIPWPDDPLLSTLCPKQETTVAYRYREHAFVCIPHQGVAHVDRSQVSTPCVYLALPCRPSSHSATNAGMTCIWEPASLLHIRFSCQHLRSAASSHSMDLNWSGLYLEECV